MQIPKADVEFKTKDWNARNKSRIYSMAVQSAHFMSLIELNVPYYFYACVLSMKFQAIGSSLSICFSVHTNYLENVGIANVIEIYKSSSSHGNTTIDS